jgi:Nucleotide modification associated domain 3
LKIVLSRKGFDSSVGGLASPILPDGTLLSLPIPTSMDNLRYEDIQLPNGRSYRQIMNEIGASNQIAGKGAHLDPDLIRSALHRHADWMPSLGQIGSAAGHLRNQKVGIDDIFLFYGWFRKTELVDGSLRYKREQGFHSIFAYLQIGEIIKTASSNCVPAWLDDHPHLHRDRVSKPTNTIFIAAKQLSFAHHLPGAGVFRESDELVLTKPGLSRGRWNLSPTMFRHLSISYHTQDAWKEGYFQSYSRAQEYVIDLDVAAEQWLKKLILESATTVESSS